MAEAAVIAATRCQNGSPRGASPISPGKDSASSKDQQTPTAGSSTPSSSSKPAELPGFSRTEVEEGPRSRLIGSVSGLPQYRQILVKGVEDQRIEMILGAVIMFNMLTLIVETDATADDSATPFWVEFGNNVLFGIYCVELTCRLAAYHLKFFSDGWNVMDFIIIFSDIVLKLLNLAVGNMPKISVLRVFRLIRICRAFKALSMFPELALLLQGFVNAIQAIIWGMSLVLVVIVVWSILAVQLIHPVNESVTEELTYERAGCVRCPRAFRSVWMSLLTIFQTLVAGDSWGQVALPIIEYSPLTGLFFLCVLVTVSMAIMNLILAVIVDRAENCQQETLAEQAAEKKHQFEAAAAELLELCAQLDADNSHCLSKEELLSGFDSKQFADAMHVMGFKKSDMDMFFDAIDEDGSGDVNYEECVAELFKFRNPEIKQVIFELTKLQVTLARMQREDDEHERQVDEREAAYIETIKSLQKQLWPPDAVQEPCYKLEDKFELEINGPGKVFI